MRIESDIKLDFKDVLFKPKRSTIKSRSDVDLCIDYTFKHSKGIYSGVPIMAANMDTTGTFEMAKVLSEHSLFTTVHKHYSVQEWIDFSEDNSMENIAISSGIGQSDFDKICQVLDQIEIPYICLDVANGYSEYFVDYIRKVRERFDKHTIIAGNVVTSEMTEQLILNGADIVKIGVGSGAACTTRKQTGVGYPQLSAVMECSDAAHGLGGHVISDGGCTCPGDVAKAFGAGADFVMLGGMLSGHDESGGKLIERNGQKYKLFYGMSSSTAMNKYSGGVADYRSSEGKTVEIEYRGKLSETIKDILGGLRSTCTYIGASKIKELSKRTTFIRVTQQMNNVFS